MEYVGVEKFNALFSQEIFSVVGLSLQVACLATVLAMPLAVLLGYVLARKQFPGKAWVSALTHVPLVLPPVVTGYLLLLAFGPRTAMGGFLSDWLGLELGFRWTGAALAAAVMAFPLMVRPIRLAFETIDAAQLEVAKTLGASNWTVWRTVSLPLAMPGILAGLVLGFAKALGEFGATITFVSNIPDETRTIALAVYTFLQSPQGDQSAFVLIVIALCISFAAIYLSEKVAANLSEKRTRNHG